MTSCCSAVNCTQKKIFSSFSYQNKLRPTSEYYYSKKAWKFIKVKPEQVKLDYRLNFLVCALISLGRSALEGNLQIFDAEFKHNINVSVVYLTLMVAINKEVV